MRAPWAAYRATCSASISGPASYTTSAPTIFGTPAFGFTQTGVSPAAASISVTTMSASFERSAAVRADGCDAEGNDGRDGVGRAQAHHRARPHVEGERHDERQVGGALNALDGPDRLFDGEDRLEDEQVDAALGECGGLLGVRRHRRVAIQQPVRLYQLSGRTERPRDEPVGAGRLAREFGCPEVDVSGAPDERAFRETERRRAERAGEDDVGARVDEAAMELDHTLGCLEQPLLGGEAGLHTHRLIVRTRRAVREQHPRAREQVGERWCPGRTHVPPHRIGVLAATAPGGAVTGPRYRLGPLVGSLAA